MNYFGWIVFSLYFFLDSSTNTSSMSSRVSFMNSSTSIEAFVGEEAVMKCVTENLANNHLVR